jgi:hypothetical protein
MRYTVRYALSLVIGRREFVVVKKVIAVACAAAAIFAVSACKSSAQNGASGISSVSTAPGISPTPAASTSAPATTPAPAVTVTVTATTAKPVSAAPCKVGSLTVTVGQDSGAAGTIVQLFTVKNKSTAACTMNKYPGIDPVGFLTQGGTKVEANLDWKVDPIPSDLQQIGAVGGLQTLAPGGSAIFFLKWSQVPVGDGKCGDATGFEFQAPQYTGTAGNYLDVSFKYTACGEQLYVSQMMNSSVGNSF